MENTFNFRKHIDRKTGLYGIKLCDEKGKPQKGWWISPSYEAVEGVWQSDNSPAWFKRNGRYGALDIPNKVELIPAKYGFPPYFNREGYAIVWKDYRSGVINIKGETVIPFKYDEIVCRTKWVDYRRSEYRFRGFACFSEDGTADIYDENFQPDELEDWEKPDEPYSDPDNKGLTTAQLEEKIRTNFRNLIEMGYNYPDMHFCFSEEHKTEIGKLEDIVKNAVRDRRHLMNSLWKHTRENAMRISRMNDLLMKAVRKAIMLGKKTARSLLWMESVPNSNSYSVEVFVYPYWQNDKSRYGYVPTEKNRSKEQDRLDNQEDNESDLHIWNIIARMGQIPNNNGITCCFHKTSWTFDPKDWNYRECVLDDGQTWDELIHFPAYQDVYFLHPFHELYCDLFDYSLEDLAAINDFRVEVKVSLQTKEQNRVPSSKKH